MFIDNETIDDIFEHFAPNLLVKKMLRVFRQLPVWNGWADYTKNTDTYSAWTELSYEGL